MPESLFEQSRRPCIFIEKEALAQALSCEFCKIFKDTHSEKVPSNKTAELTKRTSVGIWVVDTTNQLFTKDS